MAMFATYTHHTGGCNSLPRCFLPHYVSQPRVIPTPCRVPSFCCVFQWLGIHPELKTLAIVTTANQVRLLRPVMVALRDIALAVGCVWTGVIRLFVLYTNRTALPGLVCQFSSTTLRVYALPGSMHHHGIRASPWRGCVGACLLPTGEECLASCNLACFCLGVIKVFRRTNFQSVDVPVCLQYKNVRPDYLKSIWKVVNWKDVASRYDVVAK